MVCHSACQANQNLVPACCRVAELRDKGLQSASLEFPTNASLLTCMTGLNLTGPGLCGCSSQAATDSGDEDDSKKERLQAQVADAKAAYEAELARRWRLPEQLSAKLLQAITGTFEAACILLGAEHSSLVEAEQDVARVLNHRCAN